MKSIRSSEHITGYNESAIAKGETNDCVVRAIASTFGLPYDISHKFVADEFGRQNRKGTFNTILKLRDRNNVQGIQYTTIPKDQLTYPGSARHQMNGGKPTEITLSMFIEKFPTGKYLVIIKGHAFSVVDSVVIGNTEDGKRLRAKIRFAIKVKE